MIPLYILPIGKIKKSDNTRVEEDIDPQDLFHITGWSINGINNLENSFVLSPKIA